MSITDKYLDRNVIIRDKLRGCVISDAEKEKTRQEVLAMPDDEFMYKYNPYYIIISGKEDTVWYNYQGELLKNYKFSLHPSTIKFGIITSRRFHGSGTGYKEKMILLCTGAEHIGDCYFKFHLEDPYDSIISQPIHFSAARIPELMGKLLEVECTFNDTGIEITDIKAILPYNEKCRLAGYAKHIG